MVFHQGEMKQHTAWFPMMFWTSQPYRLEVRSSSKGKVQMSKPFRVLSTCAKSGFFSLRHYDWENVGLNYPRPPLNESPDSKYSCVPFHCPPPQMEWQKTYKKDKNHTVIDYTKRDQPSSECSMCWDVCQLGIQNFPTARISFKMTRWFTESSKQHPLESIPAWSEKEQQSPFNYIPVHEK